MKLCGLLVLGLLAAVLSTSGCSGNRRSYDKRSDDAAASEAAAQAAFSKLEGERPVPPAIPAQTTAAKPGELVEQKSDYSVQKPLKPGQTVTVEIDTFQVFSEDTSPREARAQTLNFIRELALEQALPQDVHISGLTTGIYVERNAQFDESIAKSVYMISSAGGRFRDEKIISSEYTPEPTTGGYRYRVRYRAEIEHQSQTYNSSFNMKMELSQNQIKDGEYIWLQLTANADGYIYLFDFYPDNTAALFWPTQLNPQNRIFKDEPWKLRILGQVEPGKDYSIETLYAVFSTRPISGWEDFKSNVSSSELVFSGGDESFILFQKWLGRSDPAQRVEKLAQVHIMGR